MEFPVALDPDHRFVEAYGIINVPTVVWVDENGRVVRPHDAQFPDDKLMDFHGKASEPHLDALRRWVIDDETPLDRDQARRGVRLPTDEEQLARAHHRVAAHLLRSGREEAARVHYEIAGDLAPVDWTIRRGKLPLLGDDPFFGDEFLALYQEWEQSGKPGYVL